MIFLTGSVYVFVEASILILFPLSLLTGEIK